VRPGGKEVDLWVRWEHRVGGGERRTAIRSPHTARAPLPPRLPTQDRARARRPGPSTGFAPSSPILTAEPHLSFPKSVASASPASNGRLQSQQLRSRGSRYGSTNSGNTAKWKLSLRELPPHARFLVSRRPRCNLGGWRRQVTLSTLWR
jgi:hypothetical protein